MKKNDERDETQLNLKPGEIHVEGDLLVFDSQKAREIYYNPPDLTGCPFEFSSLEAADRYFYPERYAGNDTAPQARPTAELLRPDEGNAALVQQAPVEMEILPSGPQIPGFFPGVRCGPIQVTGGIHLYEREPSKVQPAQPSAPKIQHPRSPTPMGMEEKLIRLERFATYERNLHHYSEERGSMKR